MENESENQDANETDGEKIDNDAMSVATKRIDETVNSETDVDDSEKTEMRAIDGKNCMTLSLPIMIILQQMKNLKS